MPGITLNADSLGRSLGNTGGGSSMPGSTMQAYVVGNDGQMYQSYSGPPNILAANQGFLQANRKAAGDMYAQTANWIDPSTGQLKPGFYPQTQAEFEALGRHSSEMAAQKQNQLYGQQASLYGFGGQGGGSGFQAGPGGAGLQFGGRQQSQQAGGATGGGSSSFTSGPVGQSDPSLYDPWKNALLDIVKNPGMSARTEQDIVNSGNEGLSRAQADAVRGQTAQANASGFINSGDAQRAQTQLSSDYAGQKAEGARSTHIAADQQRQAARLQATGQIGNYLSQQQANARADKFAMASLLNQQANQQNVPDTTNKGFSPTGGGAYAFAPPGGSGYANTSNNNPFGDFLASIGGKKSSLGGKNTGPAFQFGS